MFMAANGAVMKPLRHVGEDGRGIEADGFQSYSLPIQRVRVRNHSTGPLQQVLARSDLSMAEVVAAKARTFTSADEPIVFSA